MFPFLFANQSHSACTLASSVNGLAWCATQTNISTGETVAGRWSDCRSKHCPIECTCPEEELQVVCGSDGVTYSSACAARCKKVAVDHAGECLPLGGQCVFSQDCSKFSRCSREDCVCAHGSCHIKEFRLEGNQCEASSIFNCSCSSSPESCHCLQGHCRTEGWECHNDVECGRQGKCLQLLTPGLAELTQWRHACTCREAVCEPRELPFSCQPNYFY